MAARNWFQAATGKVIDAERLGGAEMHSRVSSAWAIPIAGAIKAAGYFAQLVGASYTRSLHA